MTMAIWQCGLHAPVMKPSEKSLHADLASSSPTFHRATYTSYLPQKSNMNTCMNTRQIVKVKKKLIFKIISLGSMSNFQRLQVYTISPFDKTLHFGMWKPGHHPTLFLILTLSRCKVEHTLWSGVHVSTVNMRMYMEHCLAKRKPQKLIVIIQLLITTLIFAVYPHSNSGTPQWQETQVETPGARARIYRSSTHVLNYRTASRFHTAKRPKVVCRGILQVWDIDLTAENNRNVSIHSGLLKIKSSWKA